METLKSPQTTKTLILVFLLSSLSFFLGNQWSSSTPPVPFFSQTLTQTISISPNANLTLDPHSLIPSPPPPPTTFGLVDSNGTMTDDFRVGTFDKDSILEEKKDPVLEKDQEEKRRESRVGVFRRCEEGMKEWIPCLDNVEEIRSSSSRGERFERRCPEKKVRCLVPAPKDYKSPIPWPRSRDEVWYSNVPHTRLVDDKGGQNWIKKDKDKFKFPGGGTQFIHGADQYLNQISEMVPDIAFGRHTRVALDVGCGVASFGAFLLSRNVITLSIAPKDVHENQIQFALERGVPAMVAAFATRRLPYPSSAFDLMHCSRCRIDWLDDGGVLLLEVNRMLRPGGYFAWAAQPVYKHEEAQQEAWKEMEKLTANICWELVKKEGYIAIWRKPLNNSCYANRETGAQPPMCDVEDDPDMVWYMDMKPCITLIPENGYGANVSVWPNRLHYPPDRLQGVVMDAYISKKELFRAESLYWKDIVGSYVRAFHWKNLKLRNVMDMRAGFGGFAAALIDHNVDCWVMNVVPISGPNTLPVIYDRGLIGVSHDWCEPFDTYPRTYDLLHAAGLFSIEHKRCKITNIMLEMDRILRPDGRAYIRDTRPIIDEIKYITDAMRWKCRLGDTEEGPYSSRSVLMCQKLLLRS